MADARPARARRLVRRALFRPLWGKKPLTHLLSHCFFTAEVV